MPTFLRHHFSQVAYNVFNCFLAEDLHHTFDLFFILRKNGSPKIFVGRKNNGLFFMV
jgi:hypothetical protein